MADSAPPQVKPAEAKQLLDESHKLLDVRCDRALGCRALLPLPPPLPLR